MPKVVHPYLIDPDHSRRLEQPSLSSHHRGTVRSALLPKPGAGSIWGGRSYDLPRHLPRLLTLGVLLFALLGLFVLGSTLYQGSRGQGLMAVVDLHAVAKTADMTTNRCSALLHPPLLQRINMAPRAQNNSRPRGIYRQADLCICPGVASYYLSELK